MQQLVRCNGFDSSWGIYGPYGEFSPKFPGHKPKLVSGSPSAAVESHEFRLDTENQIKTHTHTKPLERTQQAITLHTFGFQIGLQRGLAAAPAIRAWSDSFEALVAWIPPASAPPSLPRVMTHDAAIRESTWNLQCSLNTCISLNPIVPMKRYHKHNYTGESKYSSRFR